MPQKPDMHKVRTTNKMESHNPRCPDGLTDLQCTVYRGGYDAGQTATSIIRPDDEPQREFNFDRDEQQQQQDESRTEDDGEFVENDDDDDN